MSRRTGLRYDVVRPLAEGGFDPDEPVSGCYRVRLRREAAWSVVRIWKGPPIDPADGLPVPERGWRWQASINGIHVPVDRVWPGCARDPIDEEVYDRMIERQRAETDPGAPLANLNRPANLMRAPVPF